MGKTLKLLSIFLVLIVVYGCKTAEKKEEVSVKKIVSKNDVVVTNSAVNVEIKKTTAAAIVTDSAIDKKEDSAVNKKLEKIMDNFKDPIVTTETIITSTIEPIQADEITGENYLIGFLKNYYEVEENSIKLVVVIKLKEAKGDVIGYIASVNSEDFKSYLESKITLDDLSKLVEIGEMKQENMDALSQLEKMYSEMAGEMKKGEDSITQ